MHCGHSAAHWRMLREIGLSPSSKGIAQPLEDGSAPVPLGPVAQPAPQHWVRSEERLSPRNMTRTI